MDPKLQHNVPEEDIHECSKNDWTNDQFICEFPEHSVKYTETKPSADDHPSHISLASCKFCQQNFIVAVTPLPRTSHCTQSQDVAYSAPLKSALRREMEMYLATRPFQRITEFFLEDFVSKAFKSLSSVEEGMSDLNSSSVWHSVRPSVFESEIAATNPENNHSQEHYIPVDVVLPNKSAAESDINEAVIVDEVTSVAAMDDAVNTHTTTVESHPSSNASLPSSSILKSILLMPKKRKNSTKSECDYRFQMQSEILPSSPQMKETSDFLGKRKKDDEVGNKDINENVKEKKQKATVTRPILNASRGRPGTARKMNMKDEIERNFDEEGHVAECRLCGEQRRYDEKWYRCAVCLEFIHAACIASDSEESYTFNFAS